VIQRQRSNGSIVFRAWHWNETDADKIAECSFKVIAMDFRQVCDRAKEPSDVRSVSLSCISNSFISEGTTPDRACMRKLDIVLIIGCGCSLPGEVRHQKADLRSLIATMP